MEIDPIAENQTNVMIAKLTTRTDGDVELYHAVAALLVASQNQARELAEIKNSLWTPDALDRRIVNQHNEACKSCVTRKYVEALIRKQEVETAASNATVTPAGKGGGIRWWQIMFTKDGLLTLVVVLFALMCMYLALGREGFYDVTHTMQSHKHQNHK